MSMNRNRQPRSIRRALLAAGLGLVGTLFVGVLPAQAGANHSCSHPLVYVEDEFGPENYGFASVEISLSHTACTYVSAEFVTEDGTALDLEDYTGMKGSVAFKPGDKVKSVVIPILATPEVEPDEHFFLNLTSVSGAKVGDGTGVVTVIEVGPM